MEVPTDSHLAVPFSPFRDYLGLSGLLSRLQMSDCPSELAPSTGPCKLSSDGLVSLLTTKTTDEEVDFDLNGFSSSDTEASSETSSSCGCIGGGGNVGFLPFSVASTTTLRPKCLLAGSGQLPHGGGSRQHQRHNFCVFCKNNGEAENVYGSHVLKDGSGRTTCPILRAYTCPICGQNGDLAHTVKYCPLNETEQLSPLKTPRTSTGRRRQTSRWAVI